MAVKTWSRTVGNANWSTPSNWSGGTVPVNGDSVEFTATSVLDCTVDALGTFNDNISVLAGYTGIVTQSINISVGIFVIADGTWTKTTQTFTTLGATWSGGVFNGGSGAMTTTGSVIFSGGNLTATSATWTVSAGSFTQSNSPTFSANGGVLAFTGGTAAVLTAPSLTLSRVSFTKTNVNFTVAAGTTCPLGTGQTSSLGTGVFTVNGTVTWTDTFTLSTGGINVISTGVLTISGTLRLSVEGSVTFDASATVTSSLPLTFTGATTAVLTATAYTFATCTLSKTGQLTVAASTTLPLGANVTSTTAAAGGTTALIVTGTLTLSGTWTHTGSITVTVTTGVVSGALTTLAVTSSLTINTTANFPTTIPTTFNGSATGTVTAPNDFVFGTCAISKTAAFIINANTIIPIGSNVTTTTAASSGTDALTVTGELQVAGTWAHTGAISVSGGTGIVSGALTALSVTSSLLINNPSTFPASIPVDFTGAGIATVTSTVTTFGTCTITKTAALTISANTTIPLGANVVSSTASGTGTGLLTITGTVTLSGTWTHTGAITVSITTGVVSGALTSLAITSSLTIGTTATFPASIPVAFNGTAAATVTATAYTFPTCTLSKTNADFTVAASTTIPLGTTPTCSTGTQTFLVNGTITWTGTLTLTGALQTGSTGVITVSGTPRIIISDFLVWHASSIANITTLIPVDFTDAAANVTITAVAYAFGTCTINKPSCAQFLISSATTIPLGASPTTAIGTGSNGIIFGSGGTFTWSGTWTNVGGPITVNPTGVLTGTGSPVIDMSSCNITVGATGTVTNPFDIICVVAFNTSRSFAGGGKVYGSITISNPATDGSFNVTGANTFTFIDCNVTTDDFTLIFSNSTTYTFTDANPFRVSGTGAHRILLGSNTGAQAIFTATHPDAEVRYCNNLDIRDITVDVDPVWYTGAASTEIGDAINWVFSNPPSRSMYTGGASGNKRLTRMGF